MSFKMLLSLVAVFLTANRATIVAAPAGGSGRGSVPNTIITTTTTNSDVLYGHSQTGTDANTTTTVPILSRGVIPCPATSPCTGSITHWDGGLGACGQDVNTHTERAVALPVGIMGPLSNGNPLCGKRVMVRHGATGRTATGVVRDKCMGCRGGDLDLTDSLFEVVTGGRGRDGRVGGCSWWFV